MYIREYNKYDREECLRIFRSNMPLYFVPHELADYEKWLDGIPDRKLAYMGADAENYFVLEDEGQICACGGFYASSKEKQARMCWGMVDNASHKKGYGKIHLEHRVKTIREFFPGYQIALDTSQHTYLFYEKQGFRVTRITENAYAPGLHRYDMELGNSYSSSSTMGSQ